MYIGNTVNDKHNTQTEILTDHNQYMNTYSHSSTKAFHSPIIIIIIILGHDPIDLKIVSIWLV